MGFYFFLIPSLLSQIRSGSLSLSLVKTLGFLFFSFFLPWFFRVFEFMGLG